MLRMRDIMKTEVETVYEGLTLPELAKKFVKSQSRSFVVINNHDEIVGMVTRFDLLSLFLPSYIDLVPSFDFIDHFGALEIEKVDIDLSRFLVGDIMSYDVPTVDMNLSLTGGLIKMFQYNLESIVVAKGKRIIGQVTLNDVIEALGL